jgi:hypothetical protein
MVAGADRRGDTPPKKRFGDPQLYVKAASQPDWPFFIDTSKHCVSAD